MYAGTEVQDDFPLQSQNGTETFVRLWDGAVPFTLTLAVDLKSIEDKEAFKSDVIIDVATAAKIDAKYVRVTGLRAGSVLVDMLIAQEAGDAQKIVQDLEEQLKTPNSLLMQGKAVLKAISKTQKGPSLCLCPQITYSTEYVYFSPTIPPSSARARSLSFSLALPISPLLPPSTPPFLPMSLSLAFAIVILPPLPPPLSPPLLYLCLSSSPL
jgi:hypothetical protein